MLNRIFSILKSAELPKYYSGSAEYNLAYEGKTYHLSRPNSKFHKRLFDTYLSADSIQKQKKIFGHFDHLNGYIDIGANLGYYAVSVTTAKKFKQICLFEPSKFNFSFLQKNFKNVENCKLFKLGLSNEKGEASLAMPLSRYLNWYNKLNNTGIMSLHGNGKFRKETVELDTLDHLAEVQGIHLDNCFIKMDIEGHEYYALQGMSTALKGNNVFQVEINPTMGAEHNPQIFELFSQNGYLSFLYDEKANQFVETPWQGLKSGEVADVFFMRSKQ